MDFSIHCDYCQSYPDAYICSHSNMMFNKGKKKQARNCLFQNFYHSEWIIHPCPFFLGEIKIYNDEGKVIARRKVEQENTIFKNYKGE